MSEQSTVINYRSHWWINYVRVTSINLHYTVLISHYSHHPSLHHPFTPGLKRTDLFHRSCPPWNINQPNCRQLYLTLVHRLKLIKLLCHHHITLICQYAKVRHGGLPEKPIKQSAGRVVASIFLGLYSLSWKRCKTDTELQRTTNVKTRVILPIIRFPMTVNDLVISII